MPIFGSIRSVYIRPVVRLTPSDYALLAVLQERAAKPQDLAGRAPVHQVLRGLERLRMAGKAKPLPSGKWTAQVTADQMEQPSEFAARRRGRRKAA